MNEEFELNFVNKSDIINQGRNKPNNHTTNVNNYIRNQTNNASEYLLNKMTTSINNFLSNLRNDNSFINNNETNQKNKMYLSQNKYNKASNFQNFNDNIIKNGANINIQNQNNMYRKVSPINCLLHSINNNPNTNINLRKKMNYSPFNNSHNKTANFYNKNISDVNISQMDELEFENSYLLGKNPNIKNNNRYNNSNSISINKNDSISNCQMSLSHNHLYNNRNKNIINKYYDMLKELKQLNVKNIENKNDILCLKQNYLQLQNIILIEINKFFSKLQKPNKNLPFSENIDKINEESEYQKLKLHNLKQNEIIKKLTIENDSKENDTKTLENERNELSKKIMEYKNLMKDAKQTVKLNDSLQKKISDLENENSVAQKKYEDLSFTNNQLMNENKQYKSQINILKSQKQNVLKEYLKNKETLTNMQNINGILTKEKEEYKRKFQNLNNEYEILKMNNEKIINIKKKSMAQFQTDEKLKISLNNLNKEKNDLKKENDDLIRKIEILNNENKKMKRSRSQNPNINNKTIKSNKRFVELKKINVKPLMIICQTKKKINNNVNNNKKKNTNNVNKLLVVSNKVCNISIIETSNKKDIKKEIEKKIFNDLSIDNKINDINFKAIIKSPNKNEEPIKIEEKKPKIEFLIKNCECFSFINDRKIEKENPNEKNNEEEINNLKKEILEKNENIKLLEKEKNEAENNSNNKKVISDTGNFQINKLKDLNKLLQEKCNKLKTENQKLKEQKGASSVSNETTEKDNKIKDLEKQITEYKQKNEEQNNIIEKQNNEISNLKNNTNENEENKKLKEEIEKLKKKNNPSSLDMSVNEIIQQNYKDLEQKNALLIQKLKDAKENIKKANAVIKKVSKYNLCIKCISILVKEMKPNTDKEKALFEKFKKILSEDEKDNQKTEDKKEA